MRTVARWVADRESVNAGIAYALTVACKKLGIANPHEADKCRAAGS